MIDYAEVIQQVWSGSIQEPSNVIQFCGLFLCPEQNHFTVYRDTDAAAQLRFKGEKKGRSVLIKGQESSDLSSSFCSSNGSDQSIYTFHSHYSHRGTLKTDLR